jgi:molybdopterin-guanine dinucleotide biosynthesis protein A
MGQDKALLEFGGKALALRVADEIGKVCGAVTLVGDPVKYGALGLPVIEDRYRDQGPLAGIEAALGATEADWNLIVACDMPGLEAGWIETLFVVAEEGDGLDAVVPVHSGTGGLSAAPSRSRFGTDGEEDKEGAIEPLCAVYHRRCGVEAAARLRAGLRKVIDFVGTLERVRYVRVSRSEQFANLNTPEDAARYPNG